MKPKLHCTSLFTTWEFPERALLSNSFPIHGYVHNPEVLWVFKTPRSPKGHTSPKLQQYGLVQPQSGLLLGFLSLTTGSSPILTTNKETLVREGLSQVQVAGGRKREGPSEPSASGFPLATKIECKCQQMLTTRVCAAAPVEVFHFGPHSSATSPTHRVSLQSCCASSYCIHRKLILLTHFSVLPEVQ